jgi:hypothetical protein
MFSVDRSAVERYLAGVFGNGVTVHQVAPLGEATGGDDVKTYGYGTLLRIDYQLNGGAPRSVVLHTMRPNGFGHENMEDRAQVLLWEHRAFNHLPRHVRSVDVGVFQDDGKPVSLSNAQEFFILTEFEDGENYAQDLERLLHTGELTSLDQQRADALCDYLVDLHKTPVNRPGAYVRRIRELVGSGECIMGLTDSYPPDTTISPALLEKIEHQCVRWRWKLRQRVHRLRRTHGDFHPWNILFRKGTDFRLLDHSRGEWGEPADDVTCITANYLFFSLQRSNQLEGAFEHLFLRFWKRYLDQSGDYEMLETVAPFFAFRGLVMASPVWYPNLPEATRTKVLRFVQAVLEQGTFDPAEVNRYCRCEET